MVGMVEIVPFYEWNLQQMIAQRPPNPGRSADVSLLRNAAVPLWYSWNFHLVSASASSLVWVVLAGSKDGHLRTILVGG